MRALAFGLVPDDQRSVAARDLVALIRAAGDHLGTGFLATPFILPVLADNGYVDVAYELLFQNTEPSWLAMIDRGATTIWEQWEAMKSDGTVEASLNHYSKGAVISFLHRYTAGLQIVSPGYQSFRVAPQPGGGITTASTYHDSPYGRIEVSWSIVDGVGTLEVVVPAGSAAEVVLPDGTVSLVVAGHHRATWVTRLGHRV